MSAAESVNSPFFILGSPRSGTTMLRDLLRLHPRLECPEETHFFRWADPFSSYRFNVQYRNGKLFSRHRDLDGIDHAAFFKAFDTVNSKREIADWYGQEFLRVQGNPDGRWFDKTPQNVYSILLISAIYPDAKFVHIHRNPLNVVASLKEGKVIPTQPLRAAISAWVESAMILTQFRQGFSDRLFELPYEAVTTDARASLTRCLTFLEEDPELLDFSQVEVHKEKNKYKNILNKAEVEQVKLQTEPYLSQYGYA